MSVHSAKDPARQDNGTLIKVGHLFREFSGKMTAVCTGIFGMQHAELIEDIVQDTFLTAMKVWPVKGIPDNAEGWLMTVARNKTINALKRESRLRHELPEEAYLPDMLGDFLSAERIRDNQLRLLLSCCRPEFSDSLQIQFTLKFLCGFHNREIAGALYLTEAAVKKRIYRAVRQLRETYPDPGRKFSREGAHVKEEALSGQLPGVLRILYLMFNEGYKSSTRSGVITEDLCFEALRLVKLLPDYLDKDNDKGDCFALMALMFFNMARFPARQNEQGELIDLRQQGRQNWDRDMIQAGFRYMKKSRSGNRAGKYHLEAYIAALHSSAASYEDTRWDLIRDTYSELIKNEDSPLIRINYAVATGYAEAPEDGLNMLATMQGKSSPAKGHSTVFLIAAARADLHRLAGNYLKARSFYLEAEKQAAASADRTFIRNRLKELPGNN